MSANLLNLREHLLFDRPCRSFLLRLALCSLALSATWSCGPRLASPNREVAIEIRSELVIGPRELAAMSALEELNQVLRPRGRNAEERIAAFELHVEEHHTELYQAGLAISNYYHTLALDDRPRWLEAEAAYFESESFRFWDEIKQLKRAAPEQTERIDRILERMREEPVVVDEE